MSVYLCVGAGGMDFSQNISGELFELKMTTNTPYYVWINNKFVIHFVMKVMNKKMREIN